MRFLLVFFLLAGCSGYRFTQQENPLTQYGIQSLSVPMFYNYSTLPDVSADFTRETYALLTGFSGLRLKSGYNPNMDAVLIGIIKSSDKLIDTTKRSSSREAQKITPDAVTGREKFSVPSTTLITLSLQVIVIKKPTEEELALLRSGIGDQIKLTSRVIFNETLPLNMQYTREFMDGTGTQVVATQNTGVQRKTLENLSKLAATQVRDMILYAF
jgi:hypothetical protein